MQDVLIKKVKEIRIINKVIIYFGLGFLWSLAQVGYSFSFLTWFALVPFLFMIKYESIKSGYVYTSVFGFAVYFFHLWWMSTPIALTIDFFPPILFGLKWVIAWLVTIFVSYYHGLFYVLAFVIAKIIIRRDNDFFYLSIPLIITVLDSFFPKLWHDQIGYSQFLFFHFSQIADIFGVPFITLLVLSCNAIIINFIEAFMLKKNINLNGAIFLSLIGVIILSSVYGIFRTGQIKEISKNVSKAKIGIVQGNYSGLDKRDRSKLNDMKNEYNKLSARLLNQNPDLIIWPETAIPSVFDIKVQKYNSIKRFGRVPLFVGTHIFERDKKNNKSHYYNSSVLISKDGEKLDHYHKVKLVPFVERFPISFMNIFLNLIGYQEFSKGTGSKILEIGKIRFTPNICYESIIPEFVRKGLRINGKESNVIINITNDSWYGKSIEPLMHLRMTGFRAIENRKALIRSTCTGYSAVINPEGDIQYISPLFEKDETVQEIPLMEIGTIYNKFGWIFIYILGIILLFAFGIAVFRIMRFRYIKANLIFRKIHKRNLYRMWKD